MIYDIECYNNFFSITLKDGKRVYQYVLFNDTELKMTKERLINLIKGQTLIGFNSYTYDDVLLNYFIEVNNVTNNDLKIVNDAIISSTSTTIWQVKKKYVRFEQIFKSIDLIERHPLGLRKSLKAYEHYKRLKNISETPVDFEADVKESDIDLILRYNLDDVVATEMMYKEVLPLLDSLDDLQSKFNTRDLKSLSSGQIVDNYFKAAVQPESTPSTLTIDLKQDIDFTIKNTIVKEHLDKLQNYPVIQYPMADIKVEYDTKVKIKKFDSDIIRDCEPVFSATVLNARLDFGIGGIHSFVEPLNLKSNDEFTIIDCDVNGMYPNVIMKQQIAPFYYSEDSRSKFFDAYKEVMNKRDILKAQGSNLQESYKLLLNTLTGKFKERTSVLFDPSCHLKICTYGQYFLFSVLEQLEPYIDTICQANTDGFTLYLRRDNISKVQEILDATAGMKWKVKHFKRFVSKDVNNYLSLTDEDEVKTKGSAFNVEAFNLPQIIKKSLIDYFLFDKDVEETINNCTDIFDFLYYTKSNGTITFDDTPYNGSNIRFYKSKNGYTIKANGKQISNGYNVAELNTIDQSKLSDVDLQYYINEVKKSINNIKGNEHDEVVNLFANFGIKLCGKTPIPQEDGSKLYKGSANRGEYLYAYETVGINMIDYPDLLYIDIDHVAPEHRIMIEMGLSANTIYSTTTETINGNAESYRFFFRNNTDIAGHYRWVNTTTETPKPLTSIELWNNYANRVSISGVRKKDVSGEIVDMYVVKNDILQDLPPEIYNWIKNNPPATIDGASAKRRIKKLSNKAEYNHDENIKRLFDLIKDKYDVKLGIYQNRKIIKFTKPPTWYVQTGGWRDSAAILANPDSETFDIYTNSFTSSFGEEDKKRLLDEVKAYLRETVNEIVIAPVATQSSDNNMIEDTDEDDERILEKTPYIPQFVYDNLPPMLKDLTTKYKGREKDILFTATLSTLSCMLPECYGIYVRGTIYPNVYCIVSAGSGGGKQAAKYAFDLTYKMRIEMHNEYLREVVAFEAEEKNKKLDTPKEKTLKIAGNSSAAIFLQKLSRNDGNGLVFEGEADAVIEAFKKEWGNYDEIIRNAFQHEYLGSDRMTYNIAIERPKLSMFLSGTPAQLFNLIKSSENGLFSRFFYYIFQSKAEFIDPFEDDGEDLHKFFAAKSHKIYELYNYYKENPIKLQMTIEQKKLFFDRLSFQFYDLIFKHDGVDIEGAGKRLGTMAFKLLILLSCVRNFENPKKYDGFLEPTDTDVEIAIQLVETYSKHMEIIYVNLARQDNVKIKSNTTEKMQKFILNQTGNFTRDSILIQAKIFGMSDSNVDKIIRKLKNSNKIDKIDRFHYIVVR